MDVDEKVPAKRGRPKKNAAARAPTAEPVAAPKDEELAPTPAKRAKTASSTASPAKATGKAKASTAKSAAMMASFLSSNSSSSTPPTQEETTATSSKQSMDIDTPTAPASAPVIVLDDDTEAEKEKISAVAKNVSPVAPVRRKPSAPAKKVSTSSKDSNASADDMLSLLQTVPDGDDENRRRMWEAPVAPNRMARPLMVKSSTDSFSIGQHLAYGAENFALLEKRHFEGCKSTPLADWKIRCMPMISNDNVERFLSGEESNEFVFRYNNSEKSGTAEMAQPVELSRLKGFRGHSGDFILNAGGPVLGLEWCPLPWNNLLGDALPEAPFMHSFVAISTSKHIDEPHAINNPVNGPNMLQIWDLGPLTNLGQPSDFTPFMSIAICHEYRVFTSIAWCPIASKQPTSFSEFGQRCPNCSQMAEEIVGSSQEPKNHGQMGNTSSKNAGGKKNASEILECKDIPRLGLLAATTITGALHIYAIPHPHALRVHLCLPIDSREPLFLAPKPKLVLTTPDESMICQVAWSHHKNALRIAAGTLDGKVAVWELPEDEQELEETESDDSAMDVDTTSSSRRNTKEKNHDNVLVSVRLTDRDVEVQKEEGDVFEEEHNFEASIFGDEASIFGDSLAKMGLVTPSIPERYCPLPLYLTKPFRVPIFFQKTHEKRAVALVWHPVDPDLFVVASDQITSYFWSIRRPEAPDSSSSLQGGICREIVFGGEEVDYAFCAATDDGGVRLIVPPTSVEYRVHAKTCQSVDYSQLLRLRLSAGMDGMVYLTSLIDSKKTDAHFLSTVKNIHGVWIERICFAVPQNDRDAEEGVKVEKKTISFASSSTACANAISPTTASSGYGKRGRPTKEMMEDKEREALARGEILSSPAEKKAAKKTKSAEKEADGDGEKKKRAAKTVSARNRYHPITDLEERELKTEGYLEEDVFINKVRWCPNPMTPSWISYGTSSGLVRVQLIPWTCPPNLIDSLQSSSNDSTPKHMSSELFEGS